MMLALLTLLVASATADSESDNGCPKYPEITCKPSPYRTYNGSCNNLKHPYWGTPNSTYARYFKNSYSDGSDALPTSRKDEPLMNPRDISFRVFPDVISKDTKRNAILISWGQIVAHDMSLTAGVPQTGVDDILCCTNGEPIPEFQENPRCLPIAIPKDDPDNYPEGNTCINFYRTLSTKYLNCPVPGPAEQLSSVTAYLDLSFMYGNYETQANSLRANKTGKLTYVVRDRESWLPQDPNATFACTGLKSKDEPCYLAGDVRVNQNPQLSMVQNMLLREHNRIAEILCNVINRHWNDEKCYQEARKILIAITQHITYTEFLQIVLGKENVIKKGIMYETDGFVDDYDENVNVQTMNEHATAAYRLYHTEIVGRLKKYTAERTCIGSLRLSDWYGRPSIIEKDQNFCKLSYGFATQQQNGVDRFFDDEVTKYFFRPKGKKQGDDLRAIDIQRGRDHGIGTYATALRACNLLDPKDFRDLKKFMPSKYVDLLQQVYKDVEDIELVVAVLLETLVEGTLAGPTALCIMLEQFWRTRVGDRYFYAHGKTEGAFTLKQLKSIQNGATVARLLCDNVKCVKKMQPRAFEIISKTNPLQNCNRLPQVDLSLWRESRLTET